MESTLPNTSIGYLRTREPAPILPTALHDTSRVQRVVAHLKHNMAEPITLTELADVACCSPWHLDRLFGAATGLTPIAFLTALRIEAARTRVITSQAHIIEIAYDVGYSSLGSFGKRFTAAVGMAPRALRKCSNKFDLRRFRLLLEAASAYAPQRQPALSIRGQLRAPAGALEQCGLALLGLFQGRTPNAMPMACAVARFPGSFELRQVPDGCYSLFALAFSDGETAQQTLLQNRLPRARRHGLKLRSGVTTDVGEMLLEPPRPEDPPIVPVFPILLEQRQ